MKTPTLPDLVPEVAMPPSTPTAAGPSVSELVIRHADARAKRLQVLAVLNQLVDPDQRRRVQFIVESMAAEEHRIRVQIAATAAAVPAEAAMKLHVLANKAADRHMLAVSAARDLDRFFREVCRAE